MILLLGEENLNRTANYLVIVLYYCDYPRSRRYCHGLHCAIRPRIIFTVISRTR